MESVIEWHCEESITELNSAAKIVLKERFTAPNWKNGVGILRTRHQTDGLSNSERKSSEEFSASWK